MLTVHTHTIVLLLCLQLLPSTQSAAVAQDVRFEQHVQPLLMAKCGQCHGAETRKGDLSLLSLQDILRGGESGEPLITEQLEEGLLWAMIDSGDMPPENQTPLSKDEKKLIHRWLSTHAPDELATARGAEAVPHQHDVLPIVLLRCVTCHGAQRTDGGLDLRTPAAIKRGGRSGPALRSGDPDGSPMIQRIESQACPPRDLLLKFFVRRPAQAEVEVLRKWIAAGAPETDIRPDVATRDADPLVTDEDRRHWAFQPLRDIQAESLDEFIQRELPAHGLRPNPEADRHTLIRRAFFDLTGLPPSPGEAARWISDPDSRWFEKLVDELLQSPRYGERWGRYWLDLAGYADSEGGVSADPLRAVAWKYRDYVIASFNEDKPYDRFLIEQIAGDELIDHAAAEAVTQQMVDNLIATGFLRMGIDQTGSRTMNFVPERLGVIDDAIRVLGSGVMGLTLECARCHSHKYDAIPQRDYYRFKAILQGALDEHDWLTFKNRRLNVATAEHHVLVRRVNPPLEKQAKQLAAQLRQARQQVQLELLRQHYPDQPEVDRNSTLQALKIADNNRTQPQRVLVEMLQRVEVLDESVANESVRRARSDVRRLEAELDAVRREMVPPTTIRALWDRGRPSPTYILRRGEHDKPGRLVGPGVPSVLTDGRTPMTITPPFPDGSPKTGRRLAFAKWLVGPNQALTARVMVNRIWFHHFGAGLVRTLDNFGVQGEPPTHPELLDWLAGEFIARGWSISEMHRLIMNSRTYRQSSHTSERKHAADPQNRLWSRMTMRRLDAEALRDSILSVSGALELTAGGPPDPVTVDRDGLVTTKPYANKQWRRSVYAQYRRTELPSMMATFDYPEMGPNCVVRNVSTVSPQSLMLMNNRQIRTLAARFAQRVLDETRAQGPHTTADIVEHVYRLAFSRDPNETELALGVTSINRFQREWNGKQRRALVNYCHTILNSAEFLYVD